MTKVRTRDCSTPGGVLTKTLESVLTDGNDGGGLQITNIADPALDQDAATKKYVDDEISTREATANKDASGGYAGLTLFKINFKNVLNTFTSFFTNSNTAARTYTFQNRDGTIADDTDLALKQALVNSATALVDGATIDLTAIKHTLTTAASRTFTISYTGDDITLEITLTATSATQTFPAASLCVSEGVASGDNLLAMAGVSGDKYIIAIKKIGSAYYVVGKNFGQ